MASCVARAWVTCASPSAVEAARLAVYWLEGYGGGIWLPFTDSTSGADTYGGGRYLYDTIKGADLGIGAREMVLDFNYAYHPSCAYDRALVVPAVAAREPAAVRRSRRRAPAAASASSERLGEGPSAVQMSRIRPKNGYCGSL